MSKTILVVDDDPDTSELMKKILARLGHHITVADTGKKAIDFCAATSFDLILLDLSLPDMTGLEVTTHIKEHSKNKGTPIVIVSAHALKKEIAMVKKKAGCSYLSKPFLPEDLIKTVNSYLGK